MEKVAAADRGKGLGGIEGPMQKNGELNYGMKQFRDF